LNEKGGTLALVCIILNNNLSFHKGTFEMEMTNVMVTYVFYLGEVMLDSSTY